MISAELTIIPIGTSETSLSKYVAVAVAALDKTGIKYKLSGMGTLLETENLDELFEALKVAHEAVFRDGVNPVSYTHLDVYKRQCIYGSEAPGYRR